MVLDHAAVDKASVIRCSKLPHPDAPEWVQIWGVQVNAAAGEALESVKVAGSSAMGAVSDAATSTAAKVKEASKDSGIAHGAVVVGETVCTLSHAPLHLPLVLPNQWSQWAARWHVMMPCLQ